MLTKVKSAVMAGMEVVPVTVEVDASNGLPRPLIVGNVSKSVREALPRVDIALKNIGYPIPPKRITVNLVPADIRKDGTFFDLAIAVGILSSLGIIDNFFLKDYAFISELAFDGKLEPVRAVLPICATLKKMGVKGIVISSENLKEAEVINAIDIIAVSDLKELIDILSSKDKFNAFKRPKSVKNEVKVNYKYDFSDVKGQDYALRAAVIAAAGYHHILFSGPAGAGKTMIAKRIPSILPDLTYDENIEISKIYSICGKLPKGQGLYGRRPFRAPHHSISRAALIGGSYHGNIVPGEIVLACGGVLFLDEFPLFSKECIEALREPLESREIIINRVKGEYIYPADCLLVASMNPCPCGHYPDLSKCTCTEGMIRSYQRGISRPILERIGITVSVKAVKAEDIFSNKKGKSSKELRNLVENARHMQEKRFGNKNKLNAHMDVSDIKKYIYLNNKEEDFIKEVFKKGVLSMRGLHKMLKLARTIADIDLRDEILLSDLMEASMYRGVEEHIYGGADNDSC